MSQTSRSVAPGCPGGVPRSFSPWITRALGAAALVGLGLTVWLGLFVTPPSASMGNLVRLVYVHPSVAWVCYLAFGVTVLACLAYLWPRTRSPFWDRVGGASAEVGVVFCVLTCVSGSIWGRPTWGTYWTWDARLTSTALLIPLYLGYLALRRAGDDETARRKRASIAGIIAFLDVPLDYMTVYWWHTLHQRPTALTVDLSPKIYGLMAWTLLLSFVAFTLVYVWMMLYRYRSETLRELLTKESTALAIARRRAEAASRPAVRLAGPGDGGEVDREPGAEAAPVPEPVGGLRR